MSNGLDIAKLRLKNISNIVAKLKNGGSLTNQEQRTLDEYERAQKESEASENPSAEKALSLSEIAAICNVEPRRLQQLTQEGVMVRDKRQAYTWANVTQYVEYLQELVARRKIQPEREEGMLDPEQQRARKDRADADLKELALEEKRGIVVNAEVIEAEYGKCLLAVRSGVLSLGARVAEEIAAMREPRKVRARIDAEAWEILTNLSNYGTEDYRAQDDAEAGPAEQPKAERVGKRKSRAKS